MKSGCSWPPQPIDTAEAIPHCYVNRADEADPASRPRTIIVASLMGSKDQPASFPKLSPRRPAFARRCRFRDASRARLRNSHAGRRGEYKDRCPRCEPRRVLHSLSHQKSLRPCGRSWTRAAKKIADFAAASVDAYREGSGRAPKQPSGATRANQSRDIRSLSRTPVQADAALAQFRPREQIPRDRSWPKRDWRGEIGFTD